MTATSLRTGALLTHDDERRLANAIEAGVLASAVRAGRADRFAGGAGRTPGASDADLAYLVSEGERAWTRLADANIKLVWLVVMPLVRRTQLDANDLFQEGFLGLLEAMLRYDHTRDARFATFALPWIKMRVTNAAATNLGSIGLPPGRARAWRRVLAVEARLTSVAGRRPAVAEIARESGDAVALVGRLRAFVPIGYLAESDDLAAPEEEPADVVAGRLVRLVEELPGDLEVVVRHRFGLRGCQSMTLAQVSVELGISESTVRRREAAALEWLRDRAERLAA